MATTGEKPLKVRDKVVAARDLRAVPKGTRGVVKLVNGIAFPRYWVSWANGEWLGSILNADLVRASEVRQPEDEDDYE